MSFGQLHMSGLTENCKPFRVWTRFFLLILAFICPLQACRTVQREPGEPVRVPELSYSNRGDNAYLRSSGLKGGAWNRTDYAIVTQIDDSEIPQEFLPLLGSTPYVVWLYEIPAGKHQIEIAYKEDRFCYFGCLASEQSRRTLIFYAAPNRMYTPFAADEFCSQYFWIEDWGPDIPDSGQRSIYEFKTDLTKPVIAGHTPDQTPCD